MTEISIVSVEREARSVSRRTYSGSRNVVYQKEKHIVFCAEIIRKRWGVSPKGWKAKHLRWFFEIALKNRAVGTRYRYFHYVRQVLIFSNRWDNFAPYLNGPWQNYLTNINEENSYEI